MTDKRSEEARLQARLEELSLVYELTEYLLRGRALDDALTAFLKRLVEITEMEGALVVGADDPSEIGHTVVASVGFDTPPRRIALPNDVRDTLREHPGRVYTLGPRESDLATPARALPDGRALGSGAVVALNRPFKIVGTVILVRRNTGAPHEAALRVLRYVAPRVARRLDRERADARRVERVHRLASEANELRREKETLQEENRALRAKLAALEASRLDQPPAPADAGPAAAQTAAATTPPPPAVEGRPIEVEATPPPATELRRGRVAVIDDEPDAVRLVVRLLSHDGYEVTGYTDAREALATIAGGESFDLVLCDVRMPHLDGLTFFDQLSTSRPEMAERLVFLTGVAVEGNVTFPESLPAPALEKPVAPNRLREVVHAALSDD